MAVTSLFICVVLEQNKKGIHMIKIQKLKRPNKRSGHELKPGAKTTVKGVTMINQNTFSVWVDRFAKKK